MLWITPQESPSSGIQSSWPLSAFALALEVWLLDGAVFYRQPLGAAIGAVVALILVFTEGKPLGIGVAAIKADRPQR